MYYCTCNCCILYAYVCVLENPSYHVQHLFARLIEKSNCHAYALFKQTKFVYICVLISLYSGDTKEQTKLYY